MHAISDAINKRPATPPTMPPINAMLSSTIGAAGTAEFARVVLFARVIVSVTVELSTTFFKLVKVADVVVRETMVVVVGITGGNVGMTGGSVGVLGMIGVGVGGTVSVGTPEGKVGTRGEGGDGGVVGLTLDVVGALGVVVKGWMSVSDIGCE